MADAVFLHGKPVMADYTPQGATTAGTVVVVEDQARVVHVDLAANEKGAAAVGGGIYLMTADGLIPSGSQVYWDAAVDKVSLDPSGNHGFGWSVSSAGSDDDPINVYHDPFTGDEGTG